MPEKPSRAADYSKTQIRLVKETCLYIATVLGDYMEQVVIVGGLVPSILIDQKNLPDGADSHVGTMDLDLGFTLAMIVLERLELPVFLQAVQMKRFKQMLPVLFMHFSI